MKYKILSLMLIAFTLILFSCKSAEKKPAKPKKVKDGIGTISWDDGSIKGKGNFKNYIKDGKWTLYYKGSGEKLAQGNYVNDKQEDAWTYFHKNGAKSIEGSFQENQKTGEWKGYYDKGELMWKASYIISETEFGKAGLIEGTKISSLLFTLSPFMSPAM